MLGPLLFLVIVSTASLIVTRVGNYYQKRMERLKARVDLDGDGVVTHRELVGAMREELMRFASTVQDLQAVQRKAQELRRSSTQLRRSCMQRLQLGQGGASLPSSRPITTAVDVVSCTNAAATDVGVVKKADVVSDAQAMDWTLGEERNDRSRSAESSADADTEAAQMAPLSHKPASKAVTPAHTPITATREGMSDRIGSLFADLAEVPADEHEEKNTLPPHKPPNMRDDDHVGDGGGGTAPVTSTSMASLSTSLGALNGSNGASSLRKVKVFKVRSRRSLSLSAAAESMADSLSATADPCHVSSAQD
jgi:hypothetical protein